MDSSEGVAGAVRVVCRCNRVVAARAGAVVLLFSGPRRWPVARRREVLESNN